MTDTGLDRASLQRRTIRVLQMGVIPGGLGMTSSFSAAALLGTDLTGSESRGAFAAVCLSIGGTLAGIPLAHLMARKGRRVGLRTGYLLGMIGATSAMFAALTETYGLLVLGVLLIGSGQASNLASRYAGADLATDADRARSISVVMWASTIGSVLGPTAGLGAKTLLADSDSVTGYAIPYAFAIGLFALAAMNIHVRLRPDPLHVAGEDGHTAKFRAPSFSDLGRVILHPTARIALVGMMLSQAVMVGVMTVTPIHMRSGDQSDLIVGVMISLHIVGMYAFSPYVGRMVDRIGGELMIAIGAVTLAVGSEIASHTNAEHATGHLIGLFMVGVGWSCSVVAASSLLTASFANGERVGVQATSDVLMTGTGALAGIYSGRVVETRSFGQLAHWAFYVSVALAVLVAMEFVRRGRVGRGAMTAG